MTQYDETNRGAIWPNERKREGKKDADFTGHLNVEGREYWFNAWKRAPDANPKAPSLSFSIRPKQPSNTPAPASDDFDDDIPF